MNQPSNPKRERAQINPRLALALLAAIIVPLLAWATLAPVPETKPDAYPAWWFEREIIKRTDTNNAAPVWPQDYLPSDDYAPLTAGALKNLTVRAYGEIKSRYPTQPWTTSGSPAYALEQLIFSWYDVYPTEPKATGTANQPVNQGSLKQCAKLIYDVLGPIGYVAGGGFPPTEWNSGAYPWTATTSDDASFFPANCGAAKYLFSFDLEPFASANFDANGNGMSDEWEDDNFETPPESSDDPDSDGRSNLTEYLAGSDPNAADGEIGAAFIATGLRVFTPLE